VGEGASITVTKRGKPVARIVPYEELPPTAPDDIVERFRQARKGASLAGLDWLSLPDEGRP
jgi:prevent-host-death family protein